MGLKSGTKGKAKPRAGKGKGSKTAATPEVDYSVDPDLDYDGLTSDFNKHKGGDFFTISKPKTKVRIIPYHSASENRFKVFAVERKHFRPTSDLKICNCSGPGCPVCAVVQGIADKEVQKRLRASEKYLMVAALRDENDQIVVWRAPFGAWEDIFTVIKNKQDYPDCLSLKNGYDFIVTKTGSGAGSRYSAMPAPRRTKVTVSAPVADLDEIVGRRGQNEDLEAIAKKMRQEYNA